MTDDLSTRLLAAIETREKAAREAQPGPWHIGDAVDPTKPCNIHTFPDARGVADKFGWLDAEHIIWHDPTSVLHLCQAHREIVEEYVRVKKMRNDLSARLPNLSSVERDHLDMYDMSLNGFSFAVWALARGYGIEAQP